METKLSQQDIDEIAHKAALIVVQRLKKVIKDEMPPKMVNTNEAAKILGITPCRMRQIADRFPHVKQGENKQGKLLFVRDALLKNY